MEDALRRIPQNEVPPLRPPAAVPSGPDPTDLAVTEETAVRRFMEEGCGCQLRLRGPCSAGFTIDSLLWRRRDAQELSQNDMDMALLGQIMAFTNCSEGVVVTSKHKSAERKKAYTTFLHQGEPVCAKMFRFAVGE